MEAMQGEAPEPVRAAAPGDQTALAGALALTFVLHRRPSAFGQRPGSRKSRRGPARVELAWPQRQKLWRRADAGGTRATMTDEMATEKARASAWFGELRDAVCAAFERLEDAQTGGPHAALSPGRFGRRETRRAGEGAGQDGGDAASDGGRRRHVRHAGRPLLREGRRQRLDRLRRARRSGAALADGAARDSGVGLRPALLGRRHQPGRAYALAEMPRRAHEHADVLDARRMVVRRRLGSEPDGRGAGGHRLLPRSPARRLRCARPRLLPALQGVGGRVFPDPSIAARRAASAESSTTNLATSDWEADFAFTQDVGRAFLDAFVPLTRRHMDEPWTEEGPRLAADQARALCRVQPRLRPAARASGWKPGTMSTPY